MLTKSDCMSILVKLEDKGINIDAQMKKLILAKDLPVETLKFIAQNQGIEAVNFYEMLRRQYNKKKSKLYVNILKDSKSPEDIITTLTCLMQQIVLYNNKLESNQDAFIKEVRAGEIAEALMEYFKNTSIDKAAALLQLIKTDLLVLEYLNNRRNLEA